MSFCCPLIKNFVLSCLLLFLLNHSLSGQIKNRGIPFIKNYTEKEHKGSPQNWTIVQDHRGVMFFGSSFGFLEFDGNNWRLKGLINKTIVRSSAIDKKGRIYLGGQNDFGYLQPNAIGELDFISLKNKIDPKYQNFDDVWKTYVTEEGVIFGTNRALYYFIDDKIHVYPSGETRFHFLYHVNGRLFVSQKRKGLLELKNHKLQLIPNSEHLANSNIISMLPFLDNQVLIITGREGMFVFDGHQNFSRWNTLCEPFFSHNEIYCAEVMTDGYVLGSSNNGLLIISKDGVPIKHLNTEKGLQNNSILYVYLDNSENLWVALNNGIAFIEINSPFTAIGSHHGVSGTAYASSIINNKMYLGTSEGVFYNDWDKYENALSDITYQKVINSDGKVNNLQKINNKLLLAHHAGPFEIIDNKAHKISDHVGIWLFVPLLKHPGFILCGTYNGLLLYKIVNDKIVFLWQIKGFDESSRIIEEDEDGNIWVAHGYKGIYKLGLSDDLRKINNTSFYDSRSGFPSNLFLNVFKIKNKLVFTAETGIYQYNNKEDLFEEFPDFLPFNRNEHIGKLFEDKVGNIWFAVGEGQMGLLKKNRKGNYEVEMSLFSKLQGKMVGGFEHIAYYDEENVIIGTDDGFVHYNPTYIKKKVTDRRFNALIRKVEITKSFKDSLIFGGAFTNAIKKNILTFPQKYNSLRFSYSATSYEDIKKVQYQYLLSGFDKDWSSWTNLVHKEYTYLTEGDYTFRVRAKDGYGYISKEATYQFSVAPPWYRSRLAYFVYFLLFLLLLVVLKKLHERSIRKAKQRLRLQQEKEMILKEARHKEEALKAEKEIINLNNEKLESELNHKNKELISSTMHVMHSLQTIQKIRDEIQTVIETTNDKTMLVHLRKVLKGIEADLKFENNWEQFELHFNQIHQDFLKRLREDFPMLNAGDIKLCAYLRLNLTNKEIAPLLNLSLRGIETGRYRLRKKMNLQPEVNLNEFILNY